MHHHYQPTSHFVRKLSRLKRVDMEGYRRIQKTISRLLLHPEDADGRMVGLYDGRLKKYVGRSDFRIIYYWCRLCHRENRRQHCLIPDNSVIFFDIYHKRDKKKIKKNCNYSAAPICTRATRKT